MRKKMTMIGIIVAIACLTAVSFTIAGGREYAPVPKTEDLKTAYIEGNIIEKNGKHVITYDEINWYEGEQATEQFLAHEGDSGLDSPPDGYYIVNDNRELSELPIADNAQVLMQIYNRTGNINEADIVWNESITLDKFITILNEDDGFNLRDFPYHFTVQDGQIVRIVQQYIP